MAINVNNHKNMIKVLFIHNSIPEYRLRFMVQLSMCCDVKYLITDRNLASAIYLHENSNECSGKSSRKWNNNR